jgi:methionyl-tRNA synthetase
MDLARIRTASDVVLELARSGNYYLNVKQPWAKIKTDTNDVITTLYLGFLSIYYLGLMLHPIIPNTTRKLFNILNININSVKLTPTVVDIETPHKISKPEPLFKKLDPDFISRIDSIIDEARSRAQSKRPNVLKW